MKQGVLEGLLFVTGEDGLSLEEISKLLEITSEEALSLLEEYKKSLEDEKRGLKLVFLGNKYKLTTKEEHKSYYELLVDKVVSQTLSQSALETLAIIAYNKSITVGQIDEIRGVNSSQIVRRLLARGFIKICGKDDSIGKPNLYKTTNEFLDYFGLSSKKDLPEIINKNIEKDDNEDLYDSTYKENN